MAASGGREKHLGRFASVGLVLVMLASALAWLAPASAQPMCPFDTIWDGEAETCVPLEPTETPEPTPPQASEPEEPVGDDEPEDIASTEEPVSGAEDPEMEGGPSEEATGTPGAGFCFPSCFEGAPAQYTVTMYSCNRTPNAADTHASLMQDCWRIWDTSSVLGFNVYHNGTHVETLAAGGSTFSEAGLPRGEVGIQAFYPEDFGPVWADCHVFYLDGDDREVVTYRLPWMAPGRGMVTMPVEIAGSSFSCVWYFPPNTVMHVDAYAYTCPASVTDQTIQYDDLIVRCPGSSETEMQILSEGGIQNRIADAGWAPFRNIPVGTLQIRGFPPPGYGDPLVYCMVTGPGGQTTKGLDLEIIGSQGYVTIENNPPGGVIRCDFFFRET